MAATVVVVVWTHDLAQGVLVGVLLSGIFFASKVRRLFAVRSELSADGTARTYLYTGQIFFASVERFLAAFAFREVIDTVTIDVSRAHFWDIPPVAALDTAALKFRRAGTQVESVGLNAARPTMVDRLGVQGNTAA